MTFLVAYDIADPKRLQRVMRLVARRAHRVQKSVFLFEGTKRDVGGLLDEAARIMDLDEDCIEAWRVPDPGRRRRRGVELYVRSAVVVVGPEDLESVE